MVSNVETLRLSSLRRFLAGLVLSSFIQPGRQGPMEIGPSEASLLIEDGHLPLCLAVDPSPRTQLASPHPDPNDSYSLFILTDLCSFGDSVPQRRPVAPSTHLTELMSPISSASFASTAQGALRE